MSDDAFLRAIINNPDDDGPRLIYADWLDEQGRPERAEFIRVQVALARLTENDPRRAELQARERDLLAAHEGTWVGPLRDAASGWAFRRGFVEAVTVAGDARAGEFTRQAPAIFRLTPLRHLSFRPQTKHQRVRAGLGTLTVAETDAVGHARLRDLTRLEEMLRVRTLDLAGNDLDYGAALVLAASPNLAGLQSLDMGANRVGDEGARALANAPHLRGLAALNLSGGLDRQADWTAIGSTIANIADEGALALAHSPYLGALTSLVLYDNDLSEETKQALRQRYGDRVRF